MHHEGGTQIGVEVEQLAAVCEHSGLAYQLDVDVVDLQQAAIGRTVAVAILSGGLTAGFAPGGPFELRNEIEGPTDLDGALHRCCAFGVANGDCFSWLDRWLDCWLGWRNQFGSGLNKLQGFERCGCRGARMGNSEGQQRGEQDEHPGGYEVSSAHRVICEAIP